jgi:predicted DCC family thiol-disulfide oxidoreductase YuxK
MMRLFKQECGLGTCVPTKPAPFTSESKAGESPQSSRKKLYPLTVYFDGACPICRREIDLMKWFNRKSHLRFVDFSVPSYRPDEHGLNPSDLGRVIHARWADDSIITGVEVFREMWEGVGFGLLARVARRPRINALLVKAYAWFARNRLRLTGRA